MIAFGTHGGVSKLELVKVQQGGKLQKIASINACISSALTHLDWTLDSSVVVLNSQASELYWIDVN
jgi:microtubule-associated protein-like 6